MKFSSDEMRTVLDNLGLLAIALQKIAVSSENSEKAKDISQGTEEFLNELITPTQDTLKNAIFFISTVLSGEVLGKKDTETLAAAMYPTLFSRKNANSCASEARVESKETMENALS